MPKNMLIHDGNLEGRAPSGIAQNTYEVPSGHVPTDHIIGWAAAYARSQQGLDDLIIMCHGYESGIADPDTQTSRYVLGYGLALGEPTVMDWLMTRPGAIKFGAWEGPVLSFNPVDDSSRQIDDPPIY